MGVLRIPHGAPPLVRPSVATRVSSKHADVEHLGAPAATRGRRSTEARVEANASELENLALIAALRYLRRMVASPTRRRVRLPRDTITAVAAVLARAKSALFITGAGMSADSGLPTYRGIGGLYNRPADDGMPIEALLSGDMMETRPD